MVLPVAQPCCVHCGLTLMQGFNSSGTVQPLPTMPGSANSSLPMVVSDSGKHGYKQLMGVLGWLCLEAESPADPLAACRALCILRHYAYCTP
jgi:hypothetical protein